MATLTSTKTSAGVQPHGSRVGLYSTTGVFSANGSLSTGDVIQMVKVPSGSQLVYLFVNTQLSGVGSITVGDGVSTARYISATAVSSATGPFVINTQLVPYTYSTDDTIDVVYSGSVNASSGALYMVAAVNLDP